MACQSLPFPGESVSNTCVIASSPECSERTAKLRVMGVRAALGVPLPVGMHLSGGSAWVAFSQLLQACRACEQSENKATAELHKSKKETSRTEYYPSGNFGITSVAKKCSDTFAKQRVEIES